MKPLRYTRRNLLRGVLAATATIPLLDATRATGQTEPIRRFLAVSYPNGTRTSLFWPTGSDTSYTLNTITAPLEAHKSKLTFLRGIRLNDALQNGALGGTVGSEHARGTSGFLTARPLKSGREFVSFGNTTSGWGTGISIDQYLAERFGASTTMSSLQAGVHVRDREVRARISYAGSERPNPPREDPADVFSALFGGIVTDSSGEGADVALERLRAQRRSVFDLTKTETDRIARIVGQEDRQRLEAHLSAVRDIEQRLAAISSGGDGAPAAVGSCAAPSMTNVDLLNDGEYLEAGRLHMDLIAAAFACDQTRIATLQWSYSESEHLFQFLGFDGNHHGISHDFSQSGPGYDAYNAIQIWYQEQLSYLLDKLDSYAEGDATLLDNSLVLWGTEIGESTQHALTTMPYVLAGSAGGAIRAGRLIDYGRSERDNNQLLVSIAHAMGAEDLTEFGDPSGATGPLPDLA